MEGARAGLTARRGCERRRSRRRTCKRKRRRRPSAAILGWDPRHPDGRADREEGGCRMPPCLRGAAGENGGHGRGRGAWMRIPFGLQRRGDSRTHLRRHPRCMERSPRQPPRRARGGRRIRVRGSFHFDGLGRRRILLHVWSRGRTRWSWQTFEQPVAVRGCIRGRHRRGVSGAPRSNRRISTSGRQNSGPPERGTGTGPVSAIGDAIHPEGCRSSKPGTSTSTSMATRSAHNSKLPAFPPHSMEAGRAPGRTSLLHDGSGSFAAEGRPSVVHRPCWGRHGFGRS
mmetsp:Transcript_6971/g.42678  ORF Transcript_6971/g.42678 Transcript_6971/m.42678 type:complete len:285 (-) Transcript_6971:4235-5089(-)